MRLAIFDFDGTIYRGETLRLFLRVLGQMAGKRGAVRRFYLFQAPFYLLYRLHIARQRMITRAARALSKLFAGMGEEEMDAYLCRCLEAAKEGFDPTILARIKTHQAAGDYTVLLSGAYTRFVALVAADLGLNGWVGTELEIVKGCYTGVMGRHRIGRAKGEALGSFLQDLKRAGRKFDMEETCAYADGFHDLPLLSLVGHPVAVNPDQKLRAAAIAKGWEIL